MKFRKFYLKLKQSDFCWEIENFKIVGIQPIYCKNLACFNTCSGDGAGAGGKPELDNNSEAAAMSGNSASAFLSNGAPNPGLFKKEFACFDLCAEFSGSAFQLNGGNGDHKVFEGQGSTDRPQTHRLDTPEIHIKVSYQINLETMLMV